jgi:hypothetical protein
MVFVTSFSWIDKSTEGIVMDKRLAKASRFLWGLILAVVTLETCLELSFAQDTAASQEDQAKDPVEEMLPAFDPADKLAVDELLAPYLGKSEKWKEDVAKLAASNSTDAGPEHVLFLGSSSFRLWDSIQNDLAPLPVVRRAYGGARYRDLAIYTPELIRGLKFRKAVVFIANDITGKEQEDVDPQTVSKLARLVVWQLRQEQPDVEIYLLAVTPTPLRYKYWPRIQVTNTMLRLIADSTPGVHYIPTAYAFLDRDGMPRAELFKEDRLHLNQIGYQIWSKIVLGALETVDQVSR